MRGTTEGRHLRGSNEEYRKIGNITGKKAWWDADNRRRKSSLKIKMRTLIGRTSREGRIRLKNLQKKPKERFKSGTRIGEASTSPSGG